MNKLISYTVGLLILFLSGCASTPDNYWNGPKHDSFPNYRWETVSVEQVFHSCNFKFYSRGMACVWRLRNQGEPYCQIQSNLTESEAKQVMDFRNEYSLWYHEYVEHCVKGKSHG